ncbi:MAG: tripartite tricarboxylate transporter TctB family protein [Thermodesulfobacteriota bacterium]
MKKDIWSSLFCLLFGTYFAMGSYSLGLGEWSRPGPGYFPFGAGLLFGIFSLSVLIRALRRPPLREMSLQSSERVHWQNMALILLGMLAYSLLLKKVGFVLCTFLLVILFIRVIAKERWSKSIVTALIVAVTFHLFFNILLNAQLPSGIFRFLRI